VKNDDSGIAEKKWKAVNREERRQCKRRSEQILGDSWAEESTHEER
jgi:hypothetical protein